MAVAVARQRDDAGFSAQPAAASASKNEGGNPGDDYVMQHWNDHELEALEGMVKAEMASSAIATALGRSESAVKRKLDRIKEAGKRGKKATRRRRRRRTKTSRAKRACLSCGSTFDSEGIGNRICDTCKDGNRSLGHLEGVAA